jgi:phosphate transport system permease protein
VIGMSLYFAYALGPTFRAGLFFYGDFKAWTNGDVGTGTPFMFLVLLPLSFLAISGVRAPVTYGDRYRLALASRQAAGGSGNGSAALVADAGGGGAQLAWLLPRC